MEFTVIRTVHNGVSLFSSCFASGLFYVSFLGDKVAKLVFSRGSDDKNVSHDDDDW